MISSQVPHELADIDKVSNLPWWKVVPTASRAVAVRYTGCVINGQVVKRLLLLRTHGHNVVIDRKVQDEEKKKPTKKKSSLGCHNHFVIYYALSSSKFVIDCNELRLSVTITTLTIFNE